MEWQYEHSVGALYIRVSTHSQDELSLMHKSDSVWNMPGQITFTYRRILFLQKAFPEEAP